MTTQVYLKWSYFFAMVCLVGCIPDEPDLTGRPCPCLSDAYDCIDGVCILASDVDASAGDDVGADAIGGDAVGGGDDAGGDDTGGDVASLSDAGAEDAAADAGSDTSDVAPDATTPDVGPPDVGGPDVPVGTFCERHGGGTHLCLDFETNPTLDGWVVQTMGMGSVDFVEDMGVSGRAMRARTGESSFASLRVITTPIASGTVWYRARVRIDDVPVMFLGLMNASEAGAGARPYSQVVLLPQAIQLLQRDRDVARNITSPTAYPRDEWFCLEASFDIAMAGPSVLYLNGVEQGRLDVGTLGSWNAFSLGSLGSSAAQVPVNILYDDYVVSQTRVPCELE